MNRKAIVLASAALLCIVFVPLVAAAPILQQDRIQDCDLLQTANQEQLKTQDRDKLQARDCTNNCTCDGCADGNCTQTRDRLREWAGETGTGGVADAPIMEQYSYQYEYRHQNQQP